MDGSTGIKTAEEFSEAYSLNGSYLLNEYGRKIPDATLYEDFTRGWPEDANIGGKGRNIEAMINKFN